MKEITRIHLAKVAYDIEIDAKKAIESYMSALSAYADDKEVLLDIEIRMTELLAERGVKAGGVIGVDDVAAVRARLGEPSDFVEEGADIKPEIEKLEGAKHTKQLYRDEDSAWLGGVLAGMARYMGISAFWTRLVFIVFLFGSFGTLTLVYIILWILLPPARTAAEKLRMQGKPVTLESMKALGDRAAPAVNNTARIIKTLLVICVGIGLLLMAIGALFAVGAALFGAAFDGGIRASIEESPWYIAALGFAAASGILFVALCSMLAVALFRRSWSTAMTVATVAVVVLGIVSFGTSAGMATYGASQERQKVQDAMTSKKVDLPAEFAQVKTLKIETNDRHVRSGGIEYIVSEDAPHYEQRAIKGDTFDVTVNGTQATIKYNGSKSSLIERYGVDFSLRVYGPALDTIQSTNDSYNVTYTGKSQQSLNVQTQGSWIQVTGQYRSMNIEARGSSIVDIELASVEELMVTQRGGTVQGGVVKNLAITQPESCVSRDWDDDTAELEIDAVTSGVMTRNGVERSAKSIERPCGDIEIGNTDDEWEG